jgi:hypothetical protein
VFGMPGQGGLLSAVVSFGEALGLPVVHIAALKLL